MTLRVDLHVDGREAAATGSVLDACRSAGATVPAFCDRGHCRACMVEVDGRMVAACTTAARPGTLVATDTTRLREYRRDLFELILAEAEPRGAVRAELERAGATGARYAKRTAGRRRDESHPVLKIDLDACIDCRACVAACADVEGRFVWSATGRGAATAVSWGSGAFADSACVACGACVAACPSGAISDVDRKRTAPDERVVTTTCGYCGVGCGLEVHASAHGVTRIDGAAGEPNRGQLCVKGRYSHRFATHPDRLTTPLVRTSSGFEPISWDEAIALVAREFERLRGRLGGLSSSRCTNEENYLLQKWFRAGLGTNDVDCCARVCHAPSAAGLRRTFGTGAATNSFADIDRADLLLVVGANATESHAVLGARILQRTLAGARLVVIDPRRTELAALADVHLQPRPGTNVPLLNSLAAVIVAENRFDAEFVAARTEGFADYREFVARFPPEATESVTGVPAARVREAARL